MMGRKGKGVKVIDIPPMNLKDYGELPNYDLKLLKLRIAGLEEVRAGAHVQYNLYLNPNIIAAFVDYSTEQCFVVINDKEDKDSVIKLIEGLTVYSGSETAKYKALLETEEDVRYPDILKKRFNLELIE
ncbi:MAG: hypothetical protein JW716_05630 [Candidatus Aenigmarchaeota archaeon]|nr:hypothetical protein [Candidatus Aenigmarchaeota archaeon]